MRRTLVGIRTLIGVAALAGGPLYAQAVTGTVTYEGKVPTLRPTAMDEREREAALLACWSANRFPVAEEETQGRDARARTWLRAARTLPSLARLFAVEKLLRRDCRSRDQQRHGD